MQQRKINQLIDREEKLLRTNRHQPPNKNMQENPPKTSVEQSFLSQHLNKIPDKSMLDLQQVKNRSKKIFFIRITIDLRSFLFCGIGYLHD